MQLFGLVGVSTYCVVALLVGLRLLHLARRTRELPERLIGSAFLAGGMLGYPALVAAGLLRSAAPELALVLFFAGSAGLVGGAACLLVFWQRVYHPGRRAARRTAAVGIASLVAALIGLVLTQAPGAQPTANPWYLPGLVLQGAVYALNGWATIRYWRMLRRRLWLGLADSVVVNRFLLWGVASSAITVQYLFSTIRMVSTGTSSVDGVGAALISSLGLVAASTMFLAFLPPRWYLEAVERRSEGAEG